MTEQIELILLQSRLNTVDRLYIPTVFKEIISKDMVVESTKKQIKQIIMVTDKLPTEEVILMLQLINTQF